mmetsp:Transcript_6753/g.17284  ORF Transcript_6753/g.17284 Transcript_6753/m.17284 type:complete len:287 (+) Transcript_6753:718-1578(+)
MRGCAHVFEQLHAVAPRGAHDERNAVRHVQVGIGVDSLGQRVVHHHQPRVLLLELLQHRAGVAALPGEPTDLHHDAGDVHGRFSAAAERHGDEEAGVAAARHHRIGHRAAHLAGQVVHHDRHGSRHCPGNHGAAAEEGATATTGPQHRLQIVTVVASSPSDGGGAPELLLLVSGGERRGSAPNRWRYPTPETPPRGEAPRPLGGALRPRALGAAPREGVQPRSSEGAAGGLQDSDDDDDEKMEGKYLCFPQFKIPNCDPKNKPARHNAHFLLTDPSIRHLNVPFDA